MNGIHIKPITRDLVQFNLFQQYLCKCIFRVRSMKRRQDIRNFCAKRSKGEMNEETTPVQHITTDIDIESAVQDMGGPSAETSASVSHLRLKLFLATQTILGTLLVLNSVM